MVRFRPQQGLPIKNRALNAWQNNIEYMSFRPQQGLPIKNSKE